MMGSIKHIIDSIGFGFDNPVLQASTIIAVLIVSVAIGLYEYAVYRIVSHKGFYNKSFNISLTILPLFISTIILTLQSSLVITLGTIGALAIVRFRTAIKDPVDMIYLLWSIHTGITCGCQLYELAVLTSVTATVLLVVLNYVSFGKTPLVVVAHIDGGAADVENGISKIAKHVRVKSCNHSMNGTDLVLEVSGCAKEKLVKDFADLKIDQYTIIEYDCEDVL